MGACLEVRDDSTASAASKLVLWSSPAVVSRGRFEGISHNTDVACDSDLATRGSRIEWERRVDCFRGKRWMRRYITGSLQSRERVR